MRTATASRAASAGDATTARPPTTPTRPTATATAWVPPATTARPSPTRISSTATSTASATYATPARRARTPITTASVTVTTTARPSPTPAKRTPTTTVWATPATTARPSTTRPGRPRRRRHRGRLRATGVDRGHGRRRYPLRRRRAPVEPERRAARGHGRDPRRPGDECAHLHLARDLVRRPAGQARPDHQRRHGDASPARAEWHALQLHAPHVHRRGPARRRARAPRTGSEPARHPQEHRPPRPFTQRARLGVRHDHGRRHRAAGRHLRRDGR